MTKAIINLCKKADFQSIYLKYAKDIRRFMFFKTQDLAQAEDLMQDAFIKLWDNCKNVNPSKAKSYLMSTANNMFLNQVNHEKVVRKYKNKPVRDRTTETPEYLMIEEEFLDKIRRTIASLPDKEREVFKLSRFEKMKYAAIAEQLNISIKTVEKRMHNALIIMRKEIGDV